MAGTRARFQRAKVRELRGAVRGVRAATAALPLREWARCATVWAVHERFPRGDRHVSALRDWRVAAVERGAANVNRASDVRTVAAQRIRFMRLASRLMTKRELNMGPRFNLNLSLGYVAGSGW